MKRIHRTSGKYILRGNFHQGDFRFLPHAGKQCVANVLTFFSLIRLFEIDKFISATVDQTLYYGNILYGLIKQYVKEDYFLIDDLPRSYVVNHMIYSLSVLGSRCGMINRTECLEEVLTWAFTTGRSIFFLCQDKCIGLLNYKYRYYLFDSHSNSDAGYSISDGTSCVIQFKSLRLLCEHIQNTFISGSKKAFEAVPCEIRKHNQKSKESFEVDFSTIPSMKSQSSLSQSVKNRTICMIADINSELDEFNILKVIKGSTHQGDLIFTPYNGKQCVPNVLSFFARSIQKDIDEWSKADVDETLNEGNILYGHIRPYIKQDYLNTDDLPRQFAINHFDYSMETGLSCNGLANNLDSIQTVLAQPLSNYNGLFFICLDKCIGLKYSNGFYFLFDSHATIIPSQPSLSGTSTLIKFETYRDMCVFIFRQYAFQSNAIFEITPCNVESRSNKDSGAFPMIVGNIPNVRLTEQSIDQLRFIRKGKLGISDRETNIQCVVGDIVGKRISSLTNEDCKNKNRKVNDDTRLSANKPYMNEHEIDVHSSSNEKTFVSQSSNKFVAEVEPKLKKSSVPIKRLVIRKRFSNRPKKKNVDKNNDKCKKQTINIRSRAKSTNDDLEKNYRSNERNKDTNQETVLLEKEEEPIKVKMCDRYARDNKYILNDCSPLNSTQFDSESIHSIIEDDLANDYNEEEQYLNDNIIDLDTLDEFSIEVENAFRFDKQKKIMNEGPHFVCCVCYILCFRRGVVKISEFKISKYISYLREDYINHKELFVCHTCKNSVDKGLIPKCSYANGMRFPTQPDILKLSLEEEKLIALRLPFMQVKLLPSGFQSKLIGNVINVPTNISPGVHLLPRSINSEGTVCVRIKRKLQYKNVYRQFNVKPVKVLNALNYLLEKSILYRNAEIEVNPRWLSETINILNNTSQSNECSENLNVISNLDHENPFDLKHEAIDIDSGSDKMLSNDNIIDNMTETNSSQNINLNTGNNINDEVIDSFSEVDPLEGHSTHNTLMDDEKEGVRFLDLAPGEGNHPYNILFDINSEEMSFPSVYCGQIIKDIFPDGLTFNSRCKWELRSDDRRVGRNSELIFFKYKKYQIQFIYKNASFSMRYVKDGQQYTVADVISDERRQAISSLDNGFFQYRQLRNSPQYLQNKKKELFAMVRQMGIPTFFISLSCADTHWVGLIQSLGRIVDHKEYSEEQINSMNYLEKCRLINSDPVTCCRFFDNRFKVFLNQVLYSSSRPLGSISAHFYRIEFQHRGSPHVHMLIYCNNSPNFRRNQDNKKLCEFIDKYISCSLDVDNQSKKYVKLQMHRHAKTCRKGGKPICRFNYPIPPFPATIILEPLPNPTSKDKENYKNIQTYLDGLQDKSISFTQLLFRLHLTYYEYERAVRSSLKSPKVFLKREVSEDRVNMYMRNLLTIWQANMDCQFCVDAYSVITYILNYINKENRGLSLSLREVVNECEKNNMDIKNSIKALGNVFLKSSEVSIQEACYILLGLPLSFISRDVVSINTKEVQDRTKVLKSVFQLENCSPDDINIYNDDKFDFYRRRPVELENMSLADFCCTIERKKTSNISINYKSIVARDNSHFYCTRRTKKILSYICPSKAENEEKFYRVNLFLFSPWRDENSLCDSEGSFANYYHSLTNELKDKIQSNISQYNKEDIHHLFDIVQNVERDNIESMELQCDERNLIDAEQISISYADEEFFKPSVTSDYFSAGLQVHDTTSQTASNSKTVDRIWPYKEFSKRYDALNVKQRQVVDYVMTHITSNHEPLKLFITGGAGTGKTNVLHTIYQGLSRHYNLCADSSTDIKTVLSLAYTGKAAYLIKGETVHSGLHIRMMSNYLYYEPLNPDGLNKARCELKDVKTILIDEISLIGNKFFNFINLRLQDLKCSQEIFGGCNMIVFGDLFQLPPVKDNWIFLPITTGKSSIPCNLWQEHFSMFELTHIMRQKEDEDFANLLNRIREDNHTFADVEYIRRHTQISHSVYENIENDTLYLFPTNAQVDKINGSSHELCSGDKATVIATDKIIGNYSETEKRQLIEQCNKSGENLTSLAHTLKLGTGLIYDLVYNINVLDGLANGCYGTLKKITYREPLTKPCIVWILFEDECIGRTQRNIYKQYYDGNIDLKWTPLFPITQAFNIKRSTITVYRTQFPIKLGTAKTIHKSQGSTVSKVIVDLSAMRRNHNIMRHSAYVALSRVTKLIGLKTVNFAPSQIITDQKVKDEMIRMRSKCTLDLSYHEQEATNSFVRVYYSNSQFLKKSAKSIGADMKFKNSDITLLNETHLVENDDFPEILTQDRSICRLDCQINNTIECHSGLSLIWKNTVIVDQFFIYGINKCEFLMIEVDISENIRGLVGIFYCSCKVLREDIENMFKYLAHIAKDKKILAFAGDLNIEYSENSKFINRLCNTINCVNVGKIPSTKANTTIDYIFSQVQISVKSFYAHWSHHYVSSLQLTK